ncbi:MAG: hypothetical protein AB8B56_18115, partial [Crocinitomicaceae bacterium]
MKTSKFRPYIFASSALLLVGALALSSCKKSQLDGDSSDFLEVEKTNSSFLVKHTGTWCGPCGGWGFTTFQS